MAIGVSETTVIGPVMASGPSRSSKSSLSSGRGRVSAIESCCMRAAGSTDASGGARADAPNEVVAPKTGWAGAAPKLPCG